jgi:SWI/SNF-related matrix-associated actin-dependent regulator of chromatin subfamily B protein 1
MANVEDHIIPIRLDIELDHFRLKDTFMWNVSDTVITPELFASSICDDFGVNLHIFGPKVVAAINERVAEYRDQIAPIEQPGPSLRGKVDPEGDDAGKALLVVFRRAQESHETEASPVSDDIRTDPGIDEDDRVKVVSFDNEGDLTSLERPMSVDELEKMHENKDLDEELRLLIKIEILVGNQNLTDTFEWDLNSPVTPEEFAYSYCTELGLSGEFM